MQIAYDLHCTYFDQACQNLELYDLVAVAKAYDRASPEFARIQSFAPEKFQKFCDHITQLNQAQLDEYFKDLEKIANQDPSNHIYFEQWQVQTAAAAMKDIIREEPQRRVQADRAEDRRLEVFKTLQSDHFS